IKKVVTFGVVAVVAILVLLSSIGPADQGKASLAKTSITQTTLYVDIVGGVLRPGVYPVDPGTRLFEVVSAAGGFTKNADQKSVNLARLVTDGEQIIVLTGSGAEAAKAQINAIANPVVLKAGDKFTGTVVKLATFGAFINLVPNKDGLLHISQIRKMFGGKRIENLEDVMKVGEKVEVVIDEIDPKGKYSLVPANLPE
ncbi:MAG: hypothetical protein RLZZ378_832, partial [Actinomycetota bacterium]